MSDTVERYGLFAGGETVVVGVSGGPDSTCLLHVLGRLGAGLTLVVAHVDHALNEHSEAVATEVARVAAASGLDVHVARAKGLEGPNLHARARDFRYSFFDAIARDVGASLVATGHTLDDRVETTMARFIHGAGTDVLVGVPPAAAGRVRPLIEVRRNETRAYCDENGLGYHVDPGNDDPRFDRGAIRADVLGTIEERWGEGAIRAMAASIERLAEDSRALRDQAGILFQGMADVTEDKTLVFDLQTFLGVPRALRRRLLEEAVGRVRDRSQGIDEVLAALDRPDRKADASFDLAGGAKVLITTDGLHVTPAG